jgi:hypothetical protein
VQIFATFLSGNDHGPFFTERAVTSSWPQFAKYNHPGIDQCHHNPVRNNFWHTVMKSIISRSEANDNAWQSIPNGVNGSHELLIKMQFFLSFPTAEGGALM